MYKILITTTVCEASVKALIAYFIWRFDANLGIAAGVLLAHRLGLTVLDYYNKIKKYNAMQEFVGKSIVEELEGGNRGKPDSSAKVQ